MRSPLFVVAMLISTLTLSAQAAEEAGDMFAFETIDLEGRPFHGESLKGKTVLIDFWAVWCPPCVKAFPTLNRLQDELGGDTFQVVGMAAYSGGPEKVRKFLRGRGLRYPVVVADPDLVEQFQVIGYPTYFLVDGEGQLIAKLVGEVEDLYGEVAALVRGGSGRSTTTEER